MVGACFITIFFAAGVHFVSAILRRVAANPKAGLLGNLTGGVCEGTVMFGHCESACRGVTSRESVVLFNKRAILVCLT